MLKDSPFYVETHLGKLELTKGAFLTLQKRKQSTLRTLAKTKIIAKEEPKPTVRRCTRERCLAGNSRYDELVLFGRDGTQVRFAVLGEAERLRWKILRSLPTIQMNYDNDEES
jgi:hypothetical protein